MSKYLEFPDFAFKSTDLLLSALQAIGFRDGQIEVNTIPAGLYGYRGDLRPEKAEIVIRRQHLGPFSNDVGFAYRDGAWVPIVSEFDQEHLRKRFPNGFLPTVRGEYAACVARGLAHRLRGRVTEQRIGTTRKITVSY